MALAVSERLQSEGLRTFVPDQNVRILEPWKTGGNVFELRVLVAREDFERARELLELDGAAANEELRVPPEDVPDPRLVRARRLGEGLIIAAALVCTAPIALFIAPRYFGLVKQVGVAPRRYRVVQVATALAAFEVVALTAIGILKWT